MVPGKGMRRGRRGEREKTMQNKPGLSGSTLKIMALVFMLIDHTAAIVFPPVLARYDITFLGNLSMEYMQDICASGFAGWLYVLYQIMRRILGRLAFPIYCFLLVEGFGRTGNRKKYAGRLFLFALISEIPFNLAFRGKIFDASYQNVFVTLLLGLLMIWGMEAVREHFLAVYRKKESKEAGAYRVIIPADAAVFVAAAFAAELLRCDYGAKGMIAVGLLYAFRTDKAKQMIAGCAAFFWEFTAMFSFIFIGCYNGKRGIRLKYVFYIFYPAHLLILYLISKCV